MNQVYYIPLEIYAKIVTKQQKIYAKMQEKQENTHSI